MTKSERRSREKTPRRTRGARSAERPAAFAVKYVIAAAVLLVVLYLFAQPLYVIPDSAAYVAYARSLLWDFDVDFDNDYARLGMVETGVGGSELAARTGTGRRGNPFGAGAAILWLPFVAVTAVGVKLGALFGARAATDGFGTATVWAAHLGTWTCLLASIAIVLRMIREFFGGRGRGSGTAALAGAFLGTPLVYYVFQMPSYSHACSVFVTALLLYLSLRWRGAWTLRRAVTLGALVGLEGLVRTQGVFFWFVPLVIHWMNPGGESPESLRAAGSPEAPEGRENPRGRLTARPGLREFLRSNGSLIALYTASAVAFFAPQIAIWTIIYGSPFHLPQGEGFLHVGWGRFLGVFFSTRHGLIVGSPIVLLAAAGWAAALRRRTTRGTAVAFFLALGIQWFVNMLPNDWWAGWSFGARRFIDFVPFIAAGLVVFAAWGRVARAAIWFVTGLNLLQWLRISTGGISGETDPGWNSLWGGGFLGWLPRALEALWTVLIASPAELQVIRRPTALPPTLHTDPAGLFDVMFVIWALGMLVLAYKTRAWWAPDESASRGG